ncbi:hypothetical protein AB870_26165 (plasmid) [Pandoraea faecigallinarum]|uniref:Uncharacterized protein n=1 Tax=Pandoraea faecigallinarum TaxID=656179 RepID=A0A173H058_9BURK|nr:hypothetical protein AB870_26165 [Pandoraea faecigallinarum]
MQRQSDVDALCDALKNAKGNFRNPFMYAPNRKKDGIRILPLLEVAAKDEPLNITNVTRDGLLAAHRVPPQLNEPLSEAHRARPPRREGGRSAERPRRQGAPGSPVRRIPKMSGIHRSPARPRMPTMTAPLASRPERRQPKYGAISPAPGASDTALTRGF